ALRRRRSRNAKDTCQTDCASLVPLNRAISLTERINLVVLRHHIDIAVGKRWGTAHGASRTNFPYLAAICCIQGDHIANARSGVNLCAVNADAAAETRWSAVILHFDLQGPDFGTGLGIKSVN